MSAKDELDRWRDDLAAWAIPQHILDQAPASPWTPERAVFVRRAAARRRKPEGISFERAREALPLGGSVLDIGAGAGAASLPLLDRAGALIAVDQDEALLVELATQAGAERDKVKTIVGTWPDAADCVGPANVVVCHHVLYNVPELRPFIDALDAHARSRVVIEITAQHPVARLNPLWARFHGLERPTRPTWEDALRTIRSFHKDVHVERAPASTSPAFGSWQELVGSTTRRLCLPFERQDEVADALTELGAVASDPSTWSGADREVMTFWWDLLLPFTTASQVGVTLRPDERSRRMNAVVRASETADKTAGRTMKAVVQEGYGSADVLHVRDIPRPELMEGRVLVRMRAASVNALDWHSTHGGLLLEIVGKVMRQKDEPVRGVDLAGIVEAVGPGLTSFKPGDEVFGGAPASFAEYVRAREDRLLLKPRDLSFEQAATVNVAGRTALQGLRDHAKIKPGQRVLIHGAGGGVGTFAVQIAKALGAHVTAVTGPRNVELIESLGADQVIDYTKEDVTRRPERYDAVLDIATTRSLSSLRRVLVPNGIFVQVGAAKNGGLAGIFARIIGVMVRSRVLRQRVTFYVASNTPEDLVYLRDLIESGKLRPVIDRTYPLAEAREAVRYVGTGQARAKVVITA